VTEPGEWRVLQMIEGWQRALNLPVTIRPDDRFFCSRAEFAALVKAGKTSRMEYFYRDMRRKTGILMDQGAPVGGQWNFDSDNRKPLPKGARPPARRRFAPDAITREVLEMVSHRFADHFGELEPFGWPVTRHKHATGRGITRRCFFSCYSKITKVRAYTKSRELNIVNYVCFVCASRVATTKYSSSGRCAASKCVSPNT
jgi:pentatricopeptide repeat protein